MPSNRVKGNKFQKEVKEYLEARGWFVYNKAVGSRYEKGRDIFGCDLIAKHHKTERTLWIQATSDKAANMKRKLEPIKKVPWSFPDTIFIIVKRNPKTWSWYEYLPVSNPGEKEYYQFASSNNDSFAHAVEASKVYTNEFLNLFLP